jgi:Leucine Rich repeat
MSPKLHLCWQRRLLILLTAAVIAVAACFFASSIGGFGPDQGIVRDLALYEPETSINPHTGHVTSISFHGYVHNQPVTDEALAQVARLGELRYLGLYHSAITDSGLSQLAPLQQLRQLDLTGTKIGDEGIAALASLPALEILCLPGKNLSDRSIDSFAKMRQLRQLVIGMTAISDSAISELSKQMPALHIGSVPLIDDATEPADASSENASRVNSERPAEGVGGDQ